MPKNGYTLIELLIVLTIMAILSIVVFINYKTFSQDQILNKALGQVQTMLRLAQSNATSGLKCNNNAADSWMVEFSTNQRDIKLKCTSLATYVEKQTLTLENNVMVDTISKGSSCLTVSFPSSSMTVLYTILYGKTEFILAQGISGVECNAGVSSIGITLKRDNSTKSFSISKGGAIDVQ